MLERRTGKNMEEYITEKNKTYNCKKKKINK